MVEEKFAAAFAFQAVAANALASGHSIRDAATLALVPVQRRVHANHDRLMHG
jgi:hypothetical protein